MDDLRQTRRLRDDLRQLKAQYPELTTPGAQARLAAHMRTQIDEECIHTNGKENSMPGKGQRMLGEDLVMLNVRIPKSDMAFLDEHVRTLQKLHRYTRQGRSEAARDLIQKGIDSIEHPPTQFPVDLTPSPVPLPPPAVVPADVPAAREVETPDLDPQVGDDGREPARPRARRQPMPLEPEAFTVDLDEDVPPRAARPGRAKAPVAATTPVVTKAATPKRPARPKKS